jgi:hypothetical protein
MSSSGDVAVIHDRDDEVTITAGADSSFASRLLPSPPVASPPVRVTGREKSEFRTGYGRDGNRLEQKEKSPYLLQHKDNPVDWYHGGKKLEKARAEEKLVFLSIGY